MSALDAARRQRIVLVVAVVIASGYVWLRGVFAGLRAAGRDESRAAQTTPAPAGLAKATFATGCFWSTESDVDRLPGVITTTSGYTGGSVANPDYKTVLTGTTGHAEAVEVLYDPAVLTYDALLDHFWHNVDPFTANGQFCDLGSQYRPEIFVHDATQRAAAEASRARMQERFPGRPIVVAITDAGAFYPAENYHQDYARKNPAQYRFYRYGCGRDARLHDIWDSNPN